MSALKQINTYKMPNVSIDLSNIKIKNFNTLKGSIIETEKQNIVIEKMMNTL